LKAYTFEFVQVLKQNL